MLVTSIFGDLELCQSPRTLSHPEGEIARNIEPGDREQIAEWLATERLQVTRGQELLGQQGVPVRYTTRRRFSARAGP